MEAPNISVNMPSAGMPVSKNPESGVGKAILTVLILGALGVWAVIDKQKKGSWAPVRWIKAGRQYYQDNLQKHEDPLTRMENAIGGDAWD